MLNVSLQLFALIQCSRDVLFFFAREVSSVAETIVSDIAPSRIFCYNLLLASNAYAQRNKEQKMTSAS